jgi:hypothetical protein
MKPSTLPRRQPTKPELARFKAMADLGLTPNAIGKRVGRDPKTVRKALQSPAYQTDEDLQEMVETIRKRELSDLYLLGAKGRQRLHELLDKGDTQMIPTIALVDRTFQQRRLLEGGSTANIGLMSKIIVASDAELFRGKSTDKPKAHDVVVSQETGNP